MSRKPKPEPGLSSQTQWDDAAFFGDMEAETDPAKLIRHAGQRLDMLIGRHVSSIALDLHWPTVQLEDAIQFVSSNLDAIRTERVQTNSSQSGPASEFFQSEISSVLGEAYDALEKLNSLRATLAVLARTSVDKSAAWSPGELLLRAVDITEFLWKPTFEIDAMITDRALRLVGPARPVFTMLVETIVQMTRAPSDNRPGVPLSVSLFSDSDEISITVVASEPQRLNSSWPRRLSSLTGLLAPVGGRLDIHHSAKGDSARLRLPRKLRPVSAA